MKQRKNFFNKKLKLKTPRAARAHGKTELNRGGVGPRGRDTTGIYGSLWYPTYIFIQTESQGFAKCLWHQSISARPSQ